MTSSKSHYKEKIARRREEKLEQSDNLKYKDCAKERRENQNPDYDPRDLFLLPEPSISSDVEHTHLVKRLDYTLLNKLRSEIDKKPDGEDDKLED